MNEKLAEKIRKNEESLQNLKTKKLNIERQIENLENKIRNQKFALDNLNSRQKKVKEKAKESNLQEELEALLETEE